jgi:hypothetical protein
MATQDEISIQELKQAYRRGNLWMLGMSFEQATGKPVILQAMQADVRAHRKTDGKPAQGSLNLLCGLNQDDIAQIHYQEELTHARQM